MRRELLQRAVEPIRTGGAVAPAPRRDRPALQIAGRAEAAAPGTVGRPKILDVGTLYDQYRDNVYRFICRRVRDRNEAEDLTQETFLQAHRSAARFEGKSSVLTWLLGIARHTCLRHLRHAGRWMIGADGVSYSVDPAFDSRTESRVDAIQKLERCSEVIDQYRGKPHQTIFRLRYGDQQSIREIAEHVGKSKEAVKGSLCRSRRTLEQHLKEA